MKKAAEALHLAAEDGDVLEPVHLPVAGHSSTVVGLFKEHARRVQRFLSFRLRNAEDGREATQEVFLRLWRHEQSGSLREAATNYMYSATQSIAADVMRHRGRRPVDRLTDESPDAIAAPAPSQEDVIYWRRAMARFIAILKTLPETTRQVVVLHHVKDMNYDEIAAELGISRRTVERHIARAVSHCRARMRDYL